MERKVVKADGLGSLDPRSIWRNLLPGRPRVDFLSVQRACLPDTNVRVGTNFTETCYATDDTGLRLQWHPLYLDVVDFCSFDLHRDTDDILGPFFPSLDFLLCGKVYFIAYCFDSHILAYSTPSFISIKSRKRKRLIAVSRFVGMQENNECKCRDSKMIPNVGLVNSQ